MSDNTILYGHNANNGSFFHELTNYTSASYAQSHSTVEFDTIYQDQTYVVIGAFLADPNATGADVFDYQNYIDFSQRDFNTFKEQITQRSYFHPSVEWGGDETDHYLTLSTCDYDINNGRIVVVARALRGGGNLLVPLPTPTIPINGCRMCGINSRNMDNPFI